MADNDMLIDYDGVTPLNTIRQYLLSGRNGGDWLGNGLTSSTAGLANPRNTALGYGEAPTGRGGGTLLIKYTWYGDADLNGKVDGADYAKIDAAFNSNTLNPHWLNGDFDYNNKVDGADYALIDAAFNSQTGTLRRAVDFLSGDNRSLTGMDEPALQTVVQHYRELGDTYGLAFITSVPEPSACSALALVGGRLLRRRRRAARFS